MIPGENELDAPSLGDSLNLSVDSDDEYLFAGEEIDLDEYYQQAGKLARLYDDQITPGDLYVDFDHRPRDDNDPVFAPPPDWTADASYLMEIECNRSADHNGVHHLVMANLRANLPEDYNLADNEGFIEYYYEGDAYKLCRLPDDVKRVVVGPDEDVCIQAFFSGP